MKEIDKKRAGTKKRARVLSRDYKQYHLGYFDNQEESDKVYHEACALYDSDIDAFKLKFPKYREMKQISKEQQREKYIKHRIKIGKM